jgi:hypothetical protein
MVLAIINLAVIGDFYSTKLPTHLQEKAAKFPQNKNLAGTSSSVTLWNGSPIKPGAEPEGQDLRHAREGFTSE